MGSASASSSSQGSAPPVEPVQNVPSQSLHRDAKIEPPPADEAQQADDQTAPETELSNVNGPLPMQSMHFGSLPKWEQNQLIFMQWNLGHPSNDRGAKALQSTGHRPEVVNAARERRREVCAEHSPPKHQRPGHLKPMMDFNHKVHLDGISWANHAGKSFIFFTCWMLRPISTWPSKHHLD